MNRVSRRFRPGLDVLPSRLAPSDMTGMDTPTVDPTTPAVPIDCPIPQDPSPLEPTLPFTPPPPVD